MASLRRQVLSSFKKLHRTRQEVFKDDDQTLAVVRVRINDEYQHQKGETDQKKIKELVNIANSISDDLRKNIMQAEEVEPGKYVLKIRPENLRDNFDSNTCCKK